MNNEQGTKQGLSVSYFLKISCFLSAGLKTRYEPVKIACSIIGILYQKWKFLNRNEIIF